jgi:hypothetical protein
MSNFNWTCPHCETPVVMNDNRIETGYAMTESSMQPVEGRRWLRAKLMVCPNPICRMTTVTATLHDVGKDHVGNWVAGSVLNKWQLVPWGKAKAFPDFVPAAIREDYAEACAIKDLSPKAAATLARRAVQGIIRNYWGITKSRLIDEIKALEAMVGTNGVTQETVNNIDAVREVGNIGAHMEKDVDLIIDVDPDEAELLIQLVESLIDETYVERNRRQERSKALLALKAEKAAQKKPATGAVAAAAQPTSASPVIPPSPPHKA